MKPNLAKVICECGENWTEEGAPCLHCQTELLWNEDELTLDEAKAEHERIDKMLPTIAILVCGDCGLPESEGYVSAVSSRCIECSDEAAWQAAMDRRAELARDEEHDR